MSKTDEVAREYEENFEEYEKEARQERKESVDWEVVHQKCSLKLKCRSTKLPTSWQ